MVRHMHMVSLADLYTDPTYTEVTKSDWLRVRRYFKGTYPKPLPPIIEWTTRNDTLVPAALATAPYLVIDTEYNPTNGYMFTLGIGGPGTAVYQWWPKHTHSASSFLVHDALKELIGTRPVWFQNCYADLPILDGNLGITYADFLEVNDTCQLHSLLWCELPHNLEFLASLYGQHEKLKHLPYDDPRYNGGDIAETISLVEGLTKELDRDPQTAYIYRNCMLPLVPIVLEAQALGIRIDRSAVLGVQQLYLANRSYAATLAASYAGYPINLGSSAQLQAFLSHDLGRTIKAADEDTIAALRESVLPFDPEEEVTIESITRRLSQGAHPILEARVLYARATQWLSHYIEPMLASSSGRVFPHFHPWAQNTGRWSTVDPPLAQLPGALRDALLPDVGWHWFEFDWSAIELRLIAALSGDPIMLAGFEKDWDLHTLHMCQSFGWPEPKGWTKKDIKEDIEWQQKVPQNREEFRTFIKQMVFRLCYGGVPEGAPTIPGAKTLGLADSVLVTASKKWIAKHPHVKQFWKQITATALKARQLRTFLGRRWNFMSHDLRRIQRQMYDFPMQGAVADIKNLVLIQIKQALGDRVRLAYEMHDSLKLMIKDTPQYEEDKQTCIAIAEQVWNVNGRTINFPVEWKERKVKGCLCED